MKGGGGVWRHGGKQESAHSSGAGGGLGLRQYVCAGWRRTVT